MVKIKPKSILFLLVITFLAFGTPSFAAIYDWTGVVDSDWDVPDNWTVTGSIYTWPNEQYGGDWVNIDCDEINIATGGIVDRFDSLSIKGAADGSNEVVLTIDNNSELNVHPGWGKDIWIANGGDSKGRVEVRDGSHLELVDGAIRIGEGNTSVGTLNIINGTVDIAQWLIVGRTSTGTVELENSTINITGWGGWSSLYVAYKSDSTGTLNVNNSNVNIEAGLFIGNSDNSTGTVEIKNGNFNIGRHLSLGHDGQGTSSYMSVKNNSTINIGSNLLVGNSGSANGTLEVKDSILDIGENLNVGTSGNSTGILEVIDSTIDIGSTLQIGYSGNSTGTLEVKDSTLSIGTDLAIGNLDSSIGTIEIKGSTVGIGNNLLTGRFSSGMIEIKDSTLNIDWNLVIGEQNNSTGTVEIKDSTLNILYDLILNRKGTSGNMNIKGNSIIIVDGNFNMGAKNTLNAVSELVMDDGDIIVGSHSNLNLNGGAGSVADFTLNNGTWSNGGNLYVGKTPDGDCYLTINGGTMVSDSSIVIGKPGGGDSGESIIFLNGGVLQGEDLVFDIYANSRIVYKGGELWINNSAVTETDMQDLIDIGKIDVPSNYEITTIGDYTVLRS